LKVLLVDDSRAVLDAGRRQLQAAGHEVILHARGFGALALAQAELPDLVLVDVTSPVLQGPQLCQAIKDDPSIRHIRVLLHSPLEDEILAKRAWECGADGYVSKQWEWERRIAALLEPPAESLPAAG
jgi:two-component system cell cycle response regulator